ncbi:dynein intermediate chain 3, axonemal isoform X4 [Canis lupus familiaris]|uniref:Dynein axonemal intermediate chain 3 n=2 Tax=Canis lupus familiaris TaxID=9615 RepID=A0A8I3MDY9_CANLF|nr:dynein intermediate chain 3, axonemal isoform X4 [Canis lupus familiaris]XP_025273578.1 dynein axonemal intermediate chain 3 isoform X4 [Canis lupus dingo]XP_038397438.1 dynein intermediate chain 3, axonemal isoform X4 [Canis lupus familiaris]XP_038526183.1 dynein intermediate chain 3, axonemal isoform X4 [Canis lupus familiaris]|eukprot:XP_013970341.1 WD repeat-containing protein 63 isoform X4 [Canis lupus familiaris]
MAPKSQKQKSSGDRKNSKRSKPKPILPESEEAETLNMESMGHPEIYPLVLTTQTQEIFNCRIDEDVTDEQPYKLIKKEDIFADFQNRAAVSDFYPVRKVIQEYPGDELLVVYDKDFRYGLNFYLIGTEEGKENYLNPPEIAEEQEDYKEHIIEDLYVYRPPVSKPWVSLGSEKEIEEESVKESTKQITYMISRKRSKFGAPIKFSDQNASSVKDAYIECTAYPDRNFTLKQLEKDVGMQVVPKVKDTSTQTRWTYPKNATTQYYPREFSEEEKEIFGQSKTLSDFLNNVSVSVEIALQQNEIMNTFVDDWKCLAEEESTFGDKTDTHLKEYQSFTDLHNLKEKMVTSVSWHPTIYGLIAVSVAVRLSLEERVHFSGKLLLQPSLILFWSFSDPIHPQIVMWDITAHADRIENIKTGGSRSKKATLKPMFLLEPDSNKEATYIRHCAVSSIENGHKKVITDIHWLPDTFEINRMGSVFENRSGICCQLVTCSADCTICFWDIRPQKALTPQSVEKKKEENIEIPFDVPSTFLHLDLSWKPLIKIRLSKGETSLDHCPTKLSLNEDSLCKSQDKVLLAQSKTVKAGEMNPYYNLEGGLANHLKPIEDFCTKFFVGTEEGGVIYTDWKMERDSETGRLMAKKPVNLYTVHDGAVHTVQRSPFYKDIVLTIGGWNVAIWKEGISTGPLLQSSCAPKKYTAGHWSLTRPGVFYIGREDGYIDIWDLLEKTHEPAQSQNICITMITYIKPWTFSAKQQFIAIADYYGTLHILEIPWTLSHPSTNEVSSMNYYFEREVKHLEYIEQRKKIRDQEKKEMELELEKKKTKTYQKSKEQLEAELKMDYESYLELEETTLINLGFLKVAEKMSFMDL